MRPVKRWERVRWMLEAFRISRERELDRVIATRRRPTSITCKHSTAFTSRTLEAWACERGVQLYFTQPGKPTDNSNIQSFNGRLRDECLHVHQLFSLDDARAKLEAWLRDYNEHRPHSSLGHLTPCEFVTQCLVQRT